MSDREEKKHFSGDEDEVANAEGTSVPLLLREKVKCDLSQYTFWMLRLTPEDDRYDLNDVKELMEDITTKHVWFIAEEQSKKGIKHFHAVFIYPNKLDPREEIKSFLVGKYPDKWEKQDGNKRYNLQPAKDNNRDHKAFIYTSKDGDYIYGKGINPDYIDYVNSKSFQKMDTRIGRLMTARRSYIKGDITDRELFDIACNVCIETSSTGSINVTYVKSFMTGARVEKDPRFKDALYKSI